MEFICGDSQVGINICGVFNSVRFFFPLISSCTNFLAEVIVWNLNGNTTKKWVYPNTSKLLMFLEHEFSNQALDCKETWILYTTDFEKILTFSLANGFDLVLSLGVTTPIITPVIGISWHCIFGKVCFHILKSIGFEDLIRLFSSSSRFDRVELFRGIGSINVVGVLQKAGDTDSQAAPDPKCKSNIWSFLILPDLLDRLICTRNSMTIVLL